MNEIPDEEIDMVVTALQVHHGSLTRANRRLSGVDEPTLLARNTADLAVCERARDRFQMLQQQRRMQRNVA